MAGRGCVTCTGVLDLIGDFWPAVVASPPLKGFLLTVQIVKFTTVAAGDFVQIMARDYRMAGVMVYAFQAGIAEGLPVSNLQLRLNGSTYIPVDGRWVDWQENDAAEADWNAGGEMVAFVP